MRENQRETAIRGIKNHPLVLLVTITITIIILMNLVTDCCHGATLRPDNDDWNVNRNPNPNAEPKTYFGEWKGHQYFASPKDWRSIPVYQLITDRFADGVPQNNEGKTWGGYNLYRVDMRHGGDFKGIQSHLDYIKSLGYEAIWISPIFQNMENSYHGYAQIDFTVLDDRFGTLNELRDLVEEAHKRGIYVIVDIVVNHMADLFYFEGHRGQETPFHLHEAEYRLFPHNESLIYEDFKVSNEWDPNGFTGTIYKDDGYPTSESGRGSFSFSDFHHNGDLNDYSDAWQNHYGKIYGIMDDLRNEHPRVQEKLIAMTNALIASTDIDGIRMDTPMQVPLYFFQKWAPAVRSFAQSLGKDNFFMFGEFFCTINRAATMTGRGKTPDMYGKELYIGEEFTFNGGIYYPLYWWFNLAIKEQRGSHLDEIMTLYHRTSEIFDFYNPFRKEWRYSHLHFYNNHDQWRLSAAEDGFLKTNLATAIISFFPGIPLYYYGDEQGFLTYGTALDGWSREDMMTSLAWRNLPTVGGKNPANDDNFNMTSPHYLWTQKVNNVRRQYTSLQICDQVIERWVQSGNNNGIYAFTRECNNDRILVAFNTWKDELVAGGSLGRFLTGWKQGDSIINVMNTNERYSLETEGSLPELHLLPYETKVFVLESAWKPLDPVVTSISPYHDQVISTNETFTVKITFSEAMDVQSILKSSIQIDNVIILEEKISVGSDNLTFSFDVDRRLDDGIHYVKVMEGTARSARGRPLFGTFTSRFRKGSDENVLINPLLGSDPTLVHLLEPLTGKASLNHKAHGAKYFRVKNDEESWSEWFPYVNLSIWYIEPTTNRVTVQYWADNSASYFICWTKPNESTQFYTKQSPRK